MFKLKAAKTTKQAQQERKVKIRYRFDMNTRKN